MISGGDIAAGLVSAVVFRALSNAAYSVVQPAVDPAMPSAGPVLASAAIPFAGAALLYKKHPTIASVIAGIGIGGGVSTAEYMAYAKSGASGPMLTWNVGYDDGTVHAAAGPLQANAARIAEIDAQVVAFYKNDGHVVSIQRVGGDKPVSLLDRPPLPVQPPALPPGGGTPIIVQQSGGAYRRGVIR